MELQPISHQIWDSKYRFKRFGGEVVDLTVEQTWSRVANALAEVEKPELRSKYAAEFYEALSDYKFLPAGRIVSGAGTGRDVTLMNCYVLGTIPDNMSGIFDMLKEAALTMQQGGGIGYDFSTIRPKGAEVKGVESEASGPLSFMDCWDAMCRTIMSAGARRGAMMGTMRCDHPDIEAFIDAKKDAARFRMFNLSVLVTDAFMAAVKNDVPWHLVFGGKVYKTVQARDLWNRIMRNTYDAAEPGVIFIDRINEMNNLAYCETISATNPCGEQPLPPYGACLLGSINIARFVLNPFEATARFDTDAIRRTVRTAVRMMDNVNDVTKFPLPQQRENAQAKRRIGLGVTGLADALIMAKVKYGSDKAVEVTGRLMKLIAETALDASVDLAVEKGSFPAFDAKKFVQSNFIKQFDPSWIAAIKKHGIRNSHLTSIAPTGTISLYAGNVSSGIEPVFAFEYTRKVLEADGSKREEKVEDYAVRMWRELHGDAPLPDYFVSAQTLAPEDHIRMQAAAQQWVDSSISKTINCPEDISFDDFKRVYELAYETGCKGCTTYRPNDITGSVLSVEPAKPVEAKPVEEVSPVEIKIASPDLPRARGDALGGRTYKMKWPGYRHAVYVTINDDEDGNPFEVFFNTMGQENTAWMQALSRTVSAVFRRGGDVSFIADELREVHDPKGGAFLDGAYVPSMVAQIGNILRRHMQHREIAAQGFDAPSPPPLAAPEACPECGEYAVVRVSGCPTCQSCGVSKCG